MNATHIKTRFDVALWLTLGTGVPVNGDNWKINALTFVDGLSNPYDAPTVIQDITDVFCPKGVSLAQSLTLKAILTGGLPDFEWTVEYTDYQNNIGNPTYEDPVRLRVESVLARLFQMPEFHTM